MDQGREIGALFEDLRQGPSGFEDFGRLWEELREPAILAQIIESAPSLDAAARRLVRAANHGGGRDNISVALLSIVDRPDIPT